MIGNASKFILKQFNMTESDQFIAGVNLGMNAFGGLLDTRMFTLLLMTATTFSVYRAWKGIRDLRIDVHRAWTIRTWAYAGSVSPKI
jgi:hypothetical protein